MKNKSNAILWSILYQALICSVATSISVVFCRTGSWGCKESSQKAAIVTLIITAVLTGVSILCGTAVLFGKVLPYYVFIMTASITSITAVITLVIYLYDIITFLVLLALEYPASVAFVCLMYVVYVMCAALCGACTLVQAVQFRNPGKMINKKLTFGISIAIQIPMFILGILKATLTWCLMENIGAEAPFILAGSVIGTVFSGLTIIFGSIGLVKKRWTACNAFSACASFTLIVYLMFEVLEYTEGIKKLNDVDGQKILDLYLVITTLAVYTLSIKQGLTFGRKLRKEGNRTDEGVGTVQ